MRGFFIVMVVEQELFIIEKMQKIEEPLAAKLIPKTLEQFLGQEHILSNDKLLHRAIESDRISSVIFFGPSGTGKSALSKIISNRTQSEFVETNAVLIGVSELRKIIEEAHT